MSKQLHPHPECMAPDGADPCEGYQQALRCIADLERQLAEAQEYIKHLQNENALHVKGADMYEAQLAEAAYLDMLIHFNRIQEAINPPEDKSDD